jgi:hypothetical protein
MGGRKMRKRVLLVCFLVVALLVGVVGCGSGSGTPVNEDIKIAVLIPSSPTDGGWGQV